MKMIHELRQQQAWEAHKNASPLPIILGAVIAFGIGLLGVSGIVRVPTLLQAKTQMVPVVQREAAPAIVTIDTASRKAGRAETAPLLKTCIPMQKLGIGSDAGRSRRSVPHPAIRQCILTHRFRGRDQAERGG